MKQYIKNKKRMPSWKIHEKWCRALDVEKSICREINRIVDRSPHDIEAQIFEKGWARNNFESGRATTRIRITPGDEIDQLTTELAEITNKFGEEGIKATFNHLALDYIAELIKLGYSKEEVREKLIKKELMDYLPYYEQVFDDIFRENKPSEGRIHIKEEFEKWAKRGKGLYGAFIINSSFLTPVPALLHIKGELEKGRAVRVKWGVDVYDARRGRKTRTLHEIEDLKELISEIKCVPKP